MLNGYPSPCHTLWKLYIPNLHPKVAPVHPWLLDSRTCSITVLLQYLFWPDWHPWNVELSCTALLVHQFLLQHIILWDSLAHTSAVQKPGWHFAITLLLEKKMYVYIYYICDIYCIWDTHTYICDIYYLWDTHTFFFKHPGDHYYQMTTIWTFGLPCILQHHWRLEICIFYNISGNCDDQLTLLYCGFQIVWASYYELYLSQMLLQAPPFTL